MTVLNIYSLDDIEQQRLIASLPIGNHIIGRGDLLKVEDRKVSRNHAKIKVCDDKVTLTSLHQNPCFFKASNGRTLTVIIQHMTTELHDGDQFSLLPEDYWFRVQIIREAEEEPGLYVSGTSSPSTSTRELNGGKRLHDSHLDDSNTGLSSKKARVSTTTDDNDDSSSHTENNIGESKITEQSQSNNSESNHEKSNYSASHLQETAQVEELELQNISSETAAEHKENVVVQSNKEPHFNGEEGSSSATNTVIANSNTSQSNAPPIIKIEDIDPVPLARRERCWYGERCYRKNPNHRETFSHPGDEDYTAPNPDDDVPECPYGAACYRRNPEHRRQYKHQTKPAPQNQRPTTPSPRASPDTQSGTSNKKKPKRKKNKAKAVPNVDSKDDYDYEDPFINDGSSDDFEPSDYGIDSSESDFEDSQEVDEESQERKRMLREAKNFTKNG